MVNTNKLIFSKVCVAQSLIFCVLFCRSLFVLLTIVLFVHILLIIPPLPGGGGDILFYLCPSQDIFRCIFLSNYWWQKSDICSQASYSYAILWEAFFDPSDSYFLFAEERGYQKWALTHSSSCFFWLLIWFLKTVLSSLLKFKYI